MCRRISISPGFCLLAGWFVAANGWRLLAALLAAAAIHELGHWGVLRLLGARIVSLQIGLLGAVLETDSGTLSYGAELAAVLAGPAANLLCAFFMTAQPGLETEIGAHLVLGAFNLLPVRPLDGGRALYLAASWLLGPAAGEGIARWTGAAAAGAAAGGLLYLMHRSGGSLWLLPAVFGLTAAALREIRGLSPAS